MIYLRDRDRPDRLIFFRSRKNCFHIISWIARALFRAIGETGEIEETIWKPGLKYSCFFSLKDKMKIYSSVAWIFFISVLQSWKRLVTLRLLWSSVCWLSSSSLNEWIDYLHFKPGHKNQRRSKHEHESRLLILFHSENNLDARIRSEVFTSAKFKTDFSLILRLSCACSTFF